MGSLFGTDGVRGVANLDPMTAETALAIGQAVAHVCKRHNGRHRIVIGKDTRVSGYMLENALVSGICSMGVDALLVGPMPTPGIAYITKSMRADAGIVISASHNPFQDNGIKIFARDGYKISDEIEAEIEMLVRNGRGENYRPTAAAIGKAFRIDDALGRYIVFCKNTFPAHLGLESVKLVLDCANGATYKAAPIIFSELGAEVEVMHNRPNGLNINHNCGALHPEELAQKTVANGADAGLAFDGDGDRLIVVDNQGQILTGDHIIAICAQAMQQDGRLHNNLVVTTAMSNLGFHLAMRGLGVRVLEADVGDRHVLRIMRENAAVLGGETSGHIIFHNHHTTGDGIISALQLLAVIAGTGQKLSDLAQIVKSVPQLMLNVEVTSKPPLEELPALQTALAQARQTLGTEGRVLIRYSGTQLLCRVMVEGSDAQLTRQLAGELADIIRQEIGNN